MKIFKWNDDIFWKSIIPYASHSLPNCSYFSHDHYIKNNLNDIIYIQSPICNAISRNKDWLYLKISTGEIDKQIFLKNIKNYILKVQKSIQKKYNNRIEWDSSISNNIGHTINLYCKIIDKCLFYDINKNLLKIDSIINKTVDVIFSLSRVKIIHTLDNINNLYGKVIIEIVQIRDRESIYPSALKEYSFHSGSNIQNNNFESDNKYKKYFDMLKRGVPRGGVEQKMRFEGIDPCILDGKKPSNSNNSNTNVKKIFNETRLKNCKLKKSEINICNKNKTFKKGINLGISFEDIQDMIKKLKKTRFIKCE